MRLGHINQSHWKEGIWNQQEQKLREASLHEAWASACNGKPFIHFIHSTIIAECLFTYPALFYGTGAMVSNKSPQMSASMGLTLGRGLLTSKQNHWFQIEISTIRKKSNPIKSDGGCGGHFRVGSQGRPLWDDMWQTWVQVLVLLHETNKLPLWVSSFLSVISGVIIEDCCVESMK